MKLRVIGNGTAMGTRVIKADTGEELQGVLQIKWMIDAKTGLAEMELKLADIEIDIKPVSPQFMATPSFFVPKTTKPAGTIGIGGTQPSPFGTSAGGYGLGSGSININPAVRGTPSIMPDPMMLPSMDMSPASICAHKWVNVGFSTLKLVCKKCNREKPE